MPPSSAALDGDRAERKRGPNAGGAIATCLLGIQLAPVVQDVLKTLNVAFLDIETRIPKALRYKLVSNGGDLFPFLIYDHALLRPITPDTTLKSINLSANLQ